MHQDPLNMPHELWCSNNVPQVEEYSEKSKKPGFFFTYFQFWHFLEACAFFGTILAKEHFYLQEQMWFFDIPTCSYRFVTKIVSNLAVCCRSHGNWNWNLLGFFAIYFHFRTMCFWFNFSTEFQTLDFSSWGLSTIFHCTPNVNFRLFGSQGNFFSPIFCFWGCFFQKIMSKTSTKLKFLQCPQLQVD